ncbi:TonB-dependent receptor plug domain-containing protein [Sulfurimonas sp.]|uniref:TonB-dependent receptor plug domain-containing protein n=1 Tax=Sulfurimonas sp. TaxID=2022749 RepID=UPI002B473D18|nr:TonB-dependent receptor [Sulfurimonas sp.]
MKNKIYLSLLVSVMLINSINASDDLTDVIVTAKTQRTALDTAGSFSVITAEDIKKTGASSVQEILEGVVGLNMGMNDASINGRQNISIRGTDSKDTLILVDGERISGSDAQIGHSDFQYNWIPINAISKIEVIRGPMSAIYGSSAIGGVINIITKKPVEKIQGDIAVEGGDASRDGGKNIDFSVSAGGKITDSFSIIGYASSKIVEPEDADDTTEVEGKKIQNLMLKAWYDIDATQKITAFAILGNEKRKTDVHAELYEIKKAHYSLGYQKDFNDISLNVKYYNNTSDTHTDQFEYTHKMRDDTLNAELNIASFDNNFIVFGGEYRKEKYRKKYDDAADDTSKGFEDSINYASVYLQDEIEIGSSTILTIGARYDKHERFGGELSPKANLVYKLSDNGRLKAGYGHGFSAPTVTQTSDKYGVAIPVKFYSAGPPFYGMPKIFHRFHGNDNLKPEKSDTFEIGYDYEKDQMTFVATYFHTELTDLIDTLYTGDTMAGPMTYREYLYSNVGKARIDGLELEFTQNNISEIVDVSLNYTYLNTENKDTKKELHNRPAHTANLKLSVDLPWEIGSNFRVNYVGNQKVADGDTLDAYTTFGLQFSKEFVQDLTLSTGAENLSDVKHIGDGDNRYYIRGRYMYARLNYSF